MQTSFAEVEKIQFFWAFVGSVVGLVVGAAITLWTTERTLLAQKQQWKRDKLLHSYAEAIFYASKLQVSSENANRDPNDKEARKEVRQHVSETQRHLTLLSAFHGGSPRQIELTAAAASLAVTHRDEPQNLSSEAAKVEALLSHVFAGDKRVSFAPSTSVSTAEGQSVPAPVAAPPHSGSSDSHAFDRLELLFDYTKFHIGLYATLASAVVALIGTKWGESLLLPPFWLWVSVLSIALAGMAGGVVASSCPSFSSAKELYSTDLGPFRAKVMSGEWWTYAEHTAFWIGIGAILIAFARRGAA